MFNKATYKLLCDQVHNGGRISVASQAGRRSARRLIELGYATIVPNIETTLVVDITKRGRTAKVLADFGTWSPDFCAIEPQPSEVRDQWVIKVSTVWMPPTLMDIARHYPVASPPFI